MHAIKLHKCKQMFFIHFKAVPPPPIFFAWLSHSLTFASTPQVNPYSYAVLLIFLSII